MVQAPLKPSPLTVWVTALVTLAGTALQTFLALRPLSAIDGLTLPDDGYICLAISRSMAQGHGMSFAGVATNGFQPLWVFLNIPLFWIPDLSLDGVVHASLVMGAVLAGIAFFRMQSWWWRRPEAIWVIPTLGIFWFTASAVLVNSLNAMESALAMLMLVEIIGWVRRSEGVHPGDQPLGNALILGVLLGLGVLARIDLGLLAAVIGIWWLLTLKAGAPGPPRLKARLVRLMATTATAILVCLPWWLWSWASTGHVFPVSGQAVRIVSLGGQREPNSADYVVMRDRAWRAWESHYGGAHDYTAVGLIAVASFLMVNRRQGEFQWRRARALPLLILFCVCLVAAYVGYFFTPWFFYRYFYPLQLALTLALGLSLTEIIASLPRRKWLFASVAGLAAAVLFCGNLRLNKVVDLLLSEDSRDIGYRNIGLWARSYFPPGTVVGAHQTGALAYYNPQLRLVNLDGVVSRPSLDAILARDLAGFAIRSGVQFTVDWGINHQFTVDNSKPEDAARLVKILDVPGFRSWGYGWELHEVR